jgi:outer membrane receptor protein involved in Fe transport
MDRGGGGPFKRDRALPKLGVVFDAAPGVTLRAAYAQSMTMADADGDRLEPDQIAGFRQIEDGPLGAVTELLGAGVDLRLGDGWLAGAEAVWRDQDLDFDDRPDIDRINRRDIGGYVGRTFGRRWAVSAGLRYQRLASEFPTDLEYLRTWSAPVAVTWFDPSGLFARGVVTFVDQEIQDPGAADPTRRNDNFAVVDATVGFRIPGAPAAITLEARNLFDTDFGFETRPLLDLPGVVDQVAPPLLARERTIMLRGVVSF